MLVLIACGGSSGDVSTNKQAPGQSNAVPILAPPLYLQDMNVLLTINQVIVMKASSENGFYSSDASKFFR